jgi:hypothetical protein
MIVVRKLRSVLKKRSLPLERVLTLQRAHAQFLWVKNKF